MMINQIRADFYRQRHTWGCYLTVLLTIIFSAVITARESVGGIMINGTDLLQRLESSRWTVLSGLQSATLSSSVLLYGYLGIFVIVVGYEFSQSTYKNTLISRISRLQFIIAKFLTLFLDLLRLVLLYYLTAFLTGKIAGRAWGESLPTLLGHLGMMILTVAFFMNVIFGIGLLLLILTHSTVIAAVVIAVWPLLISLLGMATKWSWLKYFDFMGTAQQITTQTLVTIKFGPIIGTSVGLIIVIIVGSTIAIRHQEL
ncbi:ABC transporter permease [Lapidilactobacillus wuchangensis]|uniref:ABC transporter permease n=1 Tax=Lapidilactobacillus wuchangensis TaxID=2486001 RepID=UPI001785CA54|nr:ABC transporter permease [Lapidilactobacillus wuchangensis]